MNREASDQHGKGNSQCGGCGWRTEEDTEDVDDDPDAVEGTSVLWKQTICIDLCDSENVHLSHLQSSITVHVSQGSAASSENASLFGSYNNKDPSLSISSISSKHRNHSNSGDGQDNDMKIMLQQTDKAPDQKRCRLEDNDTSDEDQDELPFDSELHYATNHNHVQNSKTTPDVKMKCAQGSEFSIRRYVEENNKHTDQEHGQVLPSSPDYLRRHFSQDELLEGTRLIEAETMPEVSLLESLDESIMIRASSNSGTNSMMITTNMSCLEFCRSESQTVSEVTNSMSDCFKDPDLHCIGNVASCPEAELDLSKEKKHDVEETLNSSCSSSTPNLYKEDIRTGKVPLGRTWSCGDLKYGQGQVHYPRPDFSKVPPKVKIPKTITVSKTGFNTAVNRTPSQQGVSGKPLPSCKADVISRVLEETLWVPEKSKLLQDEEEQLKLDQDLQAECNRLLTKYEPDGNLQNVWPSVKQLESLGETHLSIHCGETVDIMDIQHGKYQIRAVTQTVPLTNTGLGEETRDTTQQDPTEGQRLTNELQDLINQFGIKVDEFKQCTDNMSMTFEEQQLMFKSMMEAQDQLERHYMSKKEEHRALEMQSYMGLNTNTGQFDPDRQVEGEIFRLGMHLEDIKEQIDRNSCRELISPTSTSHISPLHEDIIQSPSVHQTLHEESQLGCSKKEKHVHAGATDLYGSSHSTCSESSTRSREDEEGSVSIPAEEHNNEDVLAQITNQVSFKPHPTPSRSRERTAHTDEPIQQHSNEVQAYVSPETDATSERGHPPTRLCLEQDSIKKFHVNSISGTSMTDSVTSVSNVHTAVYIASCPEPDQFSCDVQNLEWKYSTHNAPVNLHMMENVLDGATPCVAQMQEAGHEERSHSLLMQRHPASMQTKGKCSNCTCSNSEAICALQYEVSQLKILLEESLGPLAYLSRLSLNTQGRRVHARPSFRHQHRSSSSRCLSMAIQKVEDWVSSDVESNRHKVSSENLSLNTYQSRSSHQRSSGGSTIHKSDTNGRPPSCSTETSIGPTHHRSRAITRQINHGNRSNQSLTLHRNSTSSNTEYIRSCFSLPSGFKVKDRQAEAEETRRRSTQSDSALLQNDDYFDWVSSFNSSHHRSRPWAQRHSGHKAEAINSTLDKALEAVSLMKRTTDRMAKTLSEDLSNARLYRTLHSQHNSERKKT